MVYVAVVHVHLWLRGMRGHLAGLDIGASSVKLLLLSGRGAALRVLFYGMAPLPPAAVQAGHINDVEAVGEAIRGLAAKSPKRPRLVATALPAALVMTKTLQVDAFADDEEIDAQISVEAERHLPYPLAEAAYDFEVQGLSESAPSEAEVLLAACRAEEAQGYRAALAAAGVRPAVLETQAFAQARALARIWPQLAKIGATEGGARADAALALLDMGATSRLLLFEPSRCLWQRELPQHSGQEAADPPQDGQALSRQVGEALQAYQAAGRRAHPWALCLAGGGAHSKGLVEAMQRETSLPVAVADPFVGMSRSAKVDPAALQRDAPALLTACGLALRSAG